MESGFGGIGRFRDIGDPYDPRRGLGPRPIIASDLDPDLMVGRGRADVSDQRTYVPKGKTTGRLKEYGSMKLVDPGMASYPGIQQRIANIDQDDIDEMMVRMIERDPEVEAPASLYPARVKIGGVDDEIRKTLQRLPKYGLDRDRDIVPNTKKDLKKGGVVSEDFKRGDVIPFKESSEAAAYGGIDIPVVGKDRQVRTTMRVYPDTERFEDKEAEGRLSGLARRLREEMTTPLINRDSLVELYRAGKTGAEKYFEHNPTPQGQVGFIVDGKDQDGKPVKTPVYESEVTADGEPLYRVGQPTGIDYDAIREEMSKQDMRLRTRVEKDPKRNRLVETGPVPFLTRNDLYAGTPGLRGAYEGRKGQSEISLAYGMSFNDLLEELAAGDFMAEPTVVNPYRGLEQDPEIGRKIFSLRAAAERTTIPEKARALSLAADRIEAGIAQVRAERLGREVDIQAFEPDYDGPIGITDVAAEIVELSRDEDSDFDFDSSGEVRPEVETGYRIDHGDQDPITYRVGEPGPVRIMGPAREEMLENTTKISAGAANALRRKYENPELAKIISALSQPEAFVYDDRTQAAFDQRLALIGSQQGREIEADSASAINAPAGVGSVAEQQALIQQIPQGARQNVIRGLAEGASPASRNASLEFLNRFRNKMFKR